MTDDVFVYMVDLPDGIREMVTPCLDGYTVYIDPRQSMEECRACYLHALYHIKNHDFEKEDVQQIEFHARKNAPAVTDALCKGDDGLEDTHNQIISEKGRKNKC